MTELEEYEVIIHVSEILYFYIKAKDIIEAQNKARHLESKGLTWLRKNAYEVDAEITDNNTDSI